jgi:hypothetical protein
VWHYRQFRNAAGLVSAGAMLGAVILSGCGSGPSHPSAQPTTTTTSTTTPPPSTTTTTTPSAAGDLSSYFASASELDSRLKAAAVAVNATIGTTQVVRSQAALDAIAVADPSPAARLIPAGLTSDVMLPVLTVQSDLDSRFYAFRGYSQAFYAGGPNAIPRTTPPSTSMTSSDYLLLCLGSGSQAAASFSADLAAAKKAAAHAPPATAVDPSSHTAADLAIWLHVISGMNAGCENCGGARFTTLEPITWHYVAPLTPGGNPWDGDVKGLLFTAHYSASQGWTIQTNAC